jgi:hypothetical protein
MKKKRSVAEQILLPAEKITALPSTNNSDEIERRGRELSRGLAKFPGNYYLGVAWALTQTWKRIRRAKRK